METSTKILSGVLGLVVLLAGLGGTIYLTTDEYDNAYVCTSSEKVGVFERLSSTGKTGYYTDSSGNQKYAVCTNGVWVHLSPYAQEKGLEPASFLASSKEAGLKEIIPSPVTYDCAGVKKYSCDSVGCVARCS